VVYSFLRPLRPVSVFNTRPLCEETLARVSAHEPLVGFEQEYYVVDEHDRPLDWDMISEDRGTELQGPFNMSLKVLKCSLTEKNNIFHSYIIGLQEKYKTNVCVRAVN